MPVSATPPGSSRWRRNAGAAHVERRRARRAKPGAPDRGPRRAAVRRPLPAGDHASHAGALDRGARGSRPARRGERVARRAERLAALRGARRGARTGGARPWPGAAVARASSRRPHGEPRGPHAPRAAQLEGGPREGPPARGALRRARRQRGPASARARRRPQHAALREPRGRDRHLRPRPQRPAAPRARRAPRPRRPAAHPRARAPRLARRVPHAPRLRPPRPLVGVADRLRLPPRPHRRLAGLEPVECECVHDWRENGLSDHSAMWARLAAGG
jgi:hypothetical protein